MTLTAPYNQDLNGTQYRIIQRLIYLISLRQFFMLLLNTKWSITLTAI